MNETNQSTGVRIAVLGATGYVGGRLVPRLLEAGHQVRCLVRSPVKILNRDWGRHDSLDVKECDLTNTCLTAEQLKECDVLIYLVHSMRSAGKSYAAADTELAMTTAEAAAKAQIKQIIYVSGLGNEDEALSKHLQSRQEVERHLHSTNIPLTTLRAAMIIGSGSSSFEILRYLVERLPIMITPRWVRTESQPVSIRNVLEAILKCIQNQATFHKTIDIGSEELVSYLSLMRMVASHLDLPRRVVIPVPVLTPRLSSLWIHLVTPVDAAIARPLAEGLSNRVICRNNQLRSLIGHAPDTPDEAIQAAVSHAKTDAIETSWTDAGPMPHDPSWSGGRVYTDRRTCLIETPPECVYEAVTIIGGGHGYYKADWLWKLRGTMDRLAGGPGLRRGRRKRTSLCEGDALDFWRVLHAEENQRLVLYAEMKLPGTATLEFMLEEDPNGTRLIQTARFRPKGILGVLYWKCVLPLHGIVFNGMLQGISQESRRIDQTKHA